MNIQTFEGGFDKNLSYLVWCTSTKAAALIDASVFPDPIIGAVEKQGLILEKMILTHSHGDHTVYCRHFVEHFPAVEILGFEKFLNPAPAGKFIGVKHHSIVKLGEIRFVVLHTPGHYPDSICLWNEREKQIFTGDTVFVGRTGRVVDPHSDPVKLYQSVYQIIHNLPNESRIYPGHHYGHTITTTIGENIRSSPFFNCKNFKEFSYVMEEFERNRKK